MLEWIARMIAAGGYWGVAALMAIENVVLPLPSELIMPLAGYDASRKGGMTLIGVILFGTVGSVLGALPMYYGARLLGKDRVSEWVDRHGRWLMLRKRDLDKANNRFKGNGVVAVTIGQLVPGVRGLISLPAGFAKMNVGLFLLANFVGTIVWCAVLAVAGKILGPAFPRIDQVLGPTGWVILAFIIIGTIGWLSWRKHKRGA